ncbi:pectinesterase inhibitor 12-like [Tripterygium wilfordii]|uniref:pectinesterase inhibitor 12-like n=1 Tax=Tripterygium wilfordii TaxID=458696 RepID=UPI0018F83882|nr:pectinesterase inhibitor 12-like [Tripterygium wilfordii]
MVKYNILVLLLLPPLLFTCLVSCNNLVQNSCKEASNGDPNLSYEFCFACLESNPKSENASNLEELVVVSLELAISNATNICCKISNLLKEEKYSNYTESALQDCLELYLDAKSTLVDARNDFNSSTINDYQKASVEVSSAMDASTTCEDGFDDEEKQGNSTHEVSPLEKENKVFFELTVIPLAFINMLH